MSTLSGLEVEGGPAVQEPVVVEDDQFAGPERDMDLVSRVIDELTLVGSRCGPFAPALRLMESGAVDPRPLITDRYSLEDGVQALERARERDAVKVLLTMGT